MAIPSWVTKSLTLEGDSPSEMEWSYGRPSSVRRKYFIEVEIPSTEDTTDKKKTWFVTNIEGATLTSTSSPIYGVPVYGAAHPVHSGLKVISHSIVTKGYLSKRVDIVVYYGIPESSTGNLTHNGQVSVPFGSWNVQVGWTNARLAGSDYRGKPFMTVAGEIVNVQTNVAMITLTKSDKVTSASIASPSINQAEITLAGITIPKHCGLRVQGNVENTGEDVDAYPRILTTQVVYIPRMISGVTGTIVNPDAEAVTEGIHTLSDVGSYDVLMLHQGYREKIADKIDYVSYFDKTLGKKMTVHGLSVLDETGAHVVPDEDTWEVTPYYLAFQVYPATAW